MIFYILNVLFILTIIFLVILLTKSQHYTNEITNYLNSVLNTINSIRYGNLSSKVNTTTIPKYKIITDSINRMTETLKDREQMILEYQNELMKKNNLLEASINSLSDGILLLDKETNIIKATPKVSDWFGISMKNLTKQKLFDHITSTKKSQTEIFNNDEIIIKHTPNNNFIMSTNIINSTDNDYQILAIIKDVTHSKEIETLKEDFVATLTHDLKVPIIAEANMLEFLLENKFGEINDKQKNALQNMQSSNKELLELVQILLETYKVKDSGIELFKENITLQDFINKIILEMQSTATKHDLKINFSCSTDIIIQADKTQLKRVIKNLISNAILHSNTKGIIDIKTNQDISNIYISIIDYGQGIAPDKINLIFDKYYSATDKFRKIGTGLGLYLSQQIIRSHNGEITVTSEENIKTEFRIRLPK